MRPIRSRLLLGSAVAVLVAGPAAAQQATPLAPVTVTATKTPQQLDNVQANITILDNETIEQRSPTKLDDLLRDQPGVEMTGGPRRIGQDVSIRGFDEQRVVVTLDGARQNFTAGHKGRFFLDPDLLRQVDIVRGSNSAIHGSGAIGGVVAMETKNAADFLQAGESAGFRTKFGYSSASNEPYYSAGVFGRAGEQVDVVANVSYRFTKDIKQGNGLRLENSEEDVRDLFLKSTIRPAEHHKLSASVIDFFGSGRVPLNADGTQNTTDNLPADRITRQRTYATTYSYDNPDQPLLNPTLKAYRNNINVDERRRGGNPADRNDESFLETNGFDLFNTSRVNLGGMKHAFTYGTEFYRDEQAGLRNKGVRAGFPNAQADVFGVYLQDEIQILENLWLTPAIRYDAYEQGGTVTNQRQEEDQLSPRLGATWRPFKFVTLFGSYGHAFRAPSLTELFISGAHTGPGNQFVPNPDLRPEKTHTYEAGTRLNFDNVALEKDRLGFDLTLYRTKATDFIETVVTGTVAAGSTTNVNIPNAEIYGGEAGATYETRYAFSRLGYSRIRGEDADTQASLDSIPADKLVAVIGGKLPEYGFRMGLRGEFAAEQDKVSGQNFISGQPTTAMKTTSGYAIYTLFASWLPPVPELAGFRVDASVENLLDKAYRRHLASLYEEGRDYRIAISYTKGF